MPTPPVDRREARESLSAARARSLDRPEDRRVHGLASIGFGLVIGGWTALARPWRDGGPSEVWTHVGYVVLLGALAIWQSRSARTWPRGSRVVAFTALGATVVLSVAATTYLNHVELTREPGQPLLALLSVVVAAPLAVAGVLIVRRGPR